MPQRAITRKPIQIFKRSTSVTKIALFTGKIKLFSQCFTVKTKMSNQKGPLLADTFPAVKIHNYCQ
ncbi:unnamed protein product, partial [Bubo scandiacus]